MKEVTLKIKGTQTTLDGEENVIELITEGKFYNKKGTYYLVYDETELSGMEGATTTLKIEDRKVSMKRFGNNKSSLVFQQGTRYKSEYGTVYGDMDMEILTKHVDVNISDKGRGNIDLIYQLSISDSIETTNKLSIDIM
ncbi:calycin-like domain-containing protein [Gottschalkia purinilytica]|uniref:Calycin-like domain-containing protein n=1 Tax=Gottschalkia purinilytica TaxID=1503 RepID=A0A0L0WE67_GOTPU|nr:DUF1934 domain-containing protein [Gottschalkia purinilytica]KNF09773.1 calycin-like domain-containing protein [Gottschalkia purinilytica]